jgi:hypothetical protein
MCKFLLENGADVDEIASDVNAPECFVYATYIPFSVFIFYC